MVSENKLTALRELLTLKNLNWDNSQIQSTVTSLRTNIKSSELSARLEKDFQEFLSFSKTNLRKLIH